jgi:hypothetical protein
VEALEAVVLEGVGKLLYWASLMGKTKQMR